jgi:hypothetical protein
MEHNFEGIPTVPPHKDLVRPAYCMRAPPSAPRPARGAPPGLAARGARPPRLHAAVTRCCAA